MDEAERCDRVGLMHKGKLVRCVAGSILDVGVDIRPGSPTYGQWASAELTAENARMLYVPAGFAHGFLVLSDTAEIIYKCTREYAPEHEGGIRWNDPQLAIKWGIDNPVLSPRDAGLPFFRDFKD